MQNHALHHLAHLGGRHRADDTTRARRKRIGQVFTRVEGLSDKLHLNYPKNAFFVKAITWRYFPAGTILFKPWPYLVLTLLCFALILRSGMRSSRAIVALLTSGLLYELTFFALPQACDIRYSFAPMAFSLFAVLVVIRGLAERSKALRDFALVDR